jgi:hypothetical protein
VNLLDANILLSQRLLLRQWRIRHRQIGPDLGRADFADYEIITLIRQRKGITLVSLDKDFFQPKWLHRNYCLLWLNVHQLKCAEYFRRFLRHPNFNTKAKRMGTVVEAAPACLHVWRLHAKRAERVPW